MRYKGLVLFLSLLSLLSCQLEGKKINRDLLIQDIRQLSHMIESVHPDPYINGGGKIAYHRRLYQVLHSCPGDGLDKEEFYRLLCPFVAKIGDSHTWLRDPYRFNYKSPGGIPLFFRVVGENVYVAAVAEEKNKNLIGTILISVEGVPWQELVRRQKERIGSENVYQILRNLANLGVLYQKNFLEHLIPEWKDKDRIEVRLKFPDGMEKDFSLNIPRTVSYPLIKPSSKFELPSRERCDFVYDFLDDEKKTVLLVVDSMQGYREVFEWMKNVGRQDFLESAKDVYKRYHNASAPKNGDDVIAGLPSATELFRELVKEMKAANTTKLIIDLRRNEGGASSMVDFLLYFLYGKDVLLSLKQELSQVTKLSEEYFIRHPGISLDSLNKDRRVSLETNDYDFSQDFYNLSHQFVGGLKNIQEEYESGLEKMPTFFSEYQSEDFNNFYRPKQVLVISSCETFSSGFTMLQYLYRAGAKIVGTPSAQAANSFGNIMSFELNNSGLTGTVSFAKYAYFHDDPEKGCVLKPDYPLTYEKLASFGFDPNAEVLYALEIQRD